MAKDFAIAFYKSAAWRKCREAYIASVNGLCETCLKAGRIKPGKILHHLEYLTPNNINDPDVTLNWDKLQFDCQDCHNKEHHGTTESVCVGLTFDANGDLIREIVPPSEL